MKYASILIILIAAACGGSKTSTGSNAADPGWRNNSIQLKVNEEKTIQLPTWASASAQMRFTLSDTSIATISRKEVVSTFDSTGLRPGDPVLANWVIRGLKRGTTNVKFDGRQPEKANSTNLRLKNFKIVVTD